MAVFDSIPTGVLLRSQPKRAAEVDDACALRQGVWHDFHRNLGRRCRKDHIQAALLNGGGVPRVTLYILPGASSTGSGGKILLAACLPVVEQDRRGIGMRSQPDQ